MRVLLIPWFGGTKNNIQKYVNVYKSMYGKNTIVDVVEYKIKDVITFTGQYNIQNGKLDHFIKHKKYDCTHMISGGCLVAKRQLASAPLQVDKMIFDSGPFYNCSDLASNYICTQVGLPKVATNPLSYAIRTYWETVDKIDYELEYKNYHDWLFNQKNSLCLLNKNDDLLDIKRIEEFVESTNTKMIEFNSPHAYLLKEEEKYKQSIIDFLNK